MKAANLAANLPAGALIWQVLDHPNAWSASEYLLAAQVDALNVSNWIAAGGKGEKPKPLDRPGAAKKKSKKAKSKGEIRAAASRFKARAQKPMHVIVPGQPAEDDPTT